MTELALLVAEVFVAVLFRGEADEAFSVDVDSQRVERSNNDVEAQVKFVPKKDQWIVDVARDDTSFILVHIFRIIDDVDASAAT